MFTVMISLLETKAQQLVNGLHLQKKQTKKNMQKGSRQIGFKGNWVQEILSKQWLWLYIVSAVENKRPAGPIRKQLTVW